MSQQDVIKFTELNVREQMKLVADWLGDQEEDLSFGLRTISDAVRLYQESLRHNDTLPEMADDWTTAQFKFAIGYNPFEEEGA